MEVRVARIFNTFGPRMHPNDGRVVSNFIIQALQGKNITIYGKRLLLVEAGSREGTMRMNARVLVLHDPSQNPTRNPPN